MQHTHYHVELPPAQVGSGSDVYIEVSLLLRRSGEPTAAMLFCVSLGVWFNLSCAAGRCIKSLFAAL